jgi:hypothetical protein
MYSTSISISHNFLFCQVLARFSSQFDIIIRQIDIKLGQFRKGSAPFYDCATKPWITKRRITKGRITKCRITKCRKNKRGNYRTSKITTECRKTKCWIWQNGKVKNVESYRKVKDKTLNPTERRNTKHRKYKTSKIKGYIGLYVKIIYLYSATNWTI